MFNQTVRPTRKALRAAGLLPQSEPEHHIVRGDSVPSQPEPVAEVLSPPRLVGDKTLIPIVSVRYVSGPGGQRFSKRNPLAVVEVSDKGVRVHPMPTPLLVILAGVLLAGWNVYWVSRTIREWRASSK